MSETCKACFSHIRALRHIRAYLNYYTEASKTIAAAIVDPRLDFYNSLLSGTSVSNLTRLQRVQNTPARVVAPKPRFCHIAPVLSGLHWLPVRHRISFKIATVLRCCNFSSHPILHLSSHDMYQREYSALLRLCQYVFLRLKPPCMATSNSFSSVAKLLQIFGMHYQIICLSFQLFQLLEELSNNLYAVYSILIQFKCWRTKNGDYMHGVAEPRLAHSAL